INANELETPNQLVVGQALVIPIAGQFYMVQSGDSLYTIAMQFGLSAEELARINNISTDQPLQFGLRLYIPEPKEKPPITSIGYTQPSGSTFSRKLINTATNNPPYLSYLAPFRY